MPSKREIEKVWDNASTIRGKNPDTWRRDEEGNKLRKGSYGTQGDYGWEVDHKKPISKGGSDNPKNLRALYWKKNRKKSDKYPK